MGATIRAAKWVLLSAVVFTMACFPAGCGGGQQDHSDLVSFDGAYSYDAGYFDVEENGITVEDFVRVNPGVNETDHVVYVFATIKADDTETLEAPVYRKDKYGIAGPKVKFTASDGSISSGQDYYNANNYNGKLDKYFNPVGYYSAYPGWNGSDVLAAGSGRQAHVVFAFQVPNDIINNGGTIEIQYGDFPIVFDGTQIQSASTLREIASSL